MSEAKRAPRVREPDAETLRFMADLERSIQEAQAGAGRLTSAATIERRTRGRPPAAVHKAPVTLRMDPEALELWRASGKGWQTRAAALLAAKAPRASTSVMPPRASRPAKRS